MTIDMHAHWFPETLADAFRKRTSKPMIFTKEDGKFIFAHFVNSH
jgi:hypothetical protein